jgi:hypothetical protein
MRGKRSAVLALVRVNAVPALVAVVLAGCGGEAELGAKDDDVRRVRDSVVGFGTTQAVRCEDADGAELRGRPVVRCSFEQEEDVSGAMRAQDRCYVVESGAVVDVTRELPIGTLRSCILNAP